MRQRSHDMKWTILLSVLAVQLLATSVSVRASASPAALPEPRLIKDINTSGAGNTSNAGEFVTIGSITYFSANDGVHGQELWRSDGTDAGTYLVKDINPGSGNSSPQSLTNVNGTLFFTAYDPTNGSELWKSDGTAAGTVLVRDINPGTGDSN